MDVTVLVQRLEACALQTMVTLEDGCVSRGVILRAISRPGGQVSVYLDECEDFDRSKWAWLPADRSLQCLELLAETVDFSEPKDNGLSIGYVRYAHADIAVGEKQTATAHFIHEIPAKR